MKKCLSVGMQKSEIQGPRDAIKNREIVKGTSTENSVCGIQNVIPFRNIDRIAVITQNYSNLENQRSIVFQKSSGLLKLDVHEFTKEMMIDIKMIWQLCESAFSEFRNMISQDKKTLFYNFIVKWNILELSIFSAKFKDPTQLYSPSGAMAKSVEEFYGFQKNAKIDKQKITEIFGPFWSFRCENVNLPLVSMKFGRIENMALLGLLFWDPGYNNLSESLVETCHAMRKIILLELNSYFENSQKFLRTLEALSLIERAEQKSREEVYLCEVHNIQFDQERKNMILWDKN